MESIIKCPKRQDCYYKLTSGSSNETSINISNEIFRALKPEGVPSGETVDISFTIYKDDYLRAICYIVGKLPLYKTSSGKSTKIEFSSTLFESLYKSIADFFGTNDKAEYKVKLYNRADSRIYLNTLEDRGFNIRKFLIEANSVLTFRNDDGNLILRLISDSRQHALYSEESPSDISSIDLMLSLLISNKNLILTGAPGTGKTYLAKNIAASIIGECSWKELNDYQRKQVEFVQFHPSYDYTDFVEGLRPNKDANFIRQDGAFKDFCKKAEENIPEPYVFIIDEINRGELSKIFGELFYSIEPDYRGEAGRVVTQYNNMVEDDDVFKEGFYIPENVYIIGTMNDVDRGVEAMDFAIRRRFAWKEVTAEESAVNMGLSEEVQGVMKALNNALTDNGLSQAYHIGGAYFRKLDGSNYQKLWENHLKGIIAEYFRGDPDADKKVEEIGSIYKSACTPSV